MLLWLLNPNLMQRLSDTQLYGGEMNAHTLLDLLTDAIFKDDRVGDISDMRQNLQLYYTEELISLYESELMAPQRAAFLHGLQKIKDYSKAPFFFGGDDATRAHRAQIARLVQEF